MSAWPSSQPDPRPSTSSTLPSPPALLWPSPSPLGAPPHASTSTTHYPYSFHSQQPSHPSPAAFPPPDPSTSARSHQPTQHPPAAAGTKRGRTETPERDGEEGSGSGTPAAQEERTSGGGTAGPSRLSNAKMSKKPKPRPPAPSGATVTDKSCGHCRSRKGEHQFLSLFSFFLRANLFSLQSAATASFQSVTIAFSVARSVISRTGSRNRR
jgi:hypothetical protein